MFLISNKLNPFSFDLQKKKKPDPVSVDDLDRIQSTFRQLVRDWSEEGSKERELCYGPIINAIKQCFPPKSK